MNRAHPPPLRRHQAEAVAALETAWEQGRTRTWVVLPPGAGKTRVGLEGVLRVPGIERAVVLGPNTAIQAQWELQAMRLGIWAGSDRDLTDRLTALTYQSLAVFDADAEVDDEGAQTPLLARLHDNGRALVSTLRDAGPILLVLDECHHLLEVWGRLLQELLEELPQARVLGLTATPPDALSAEQALLMHTLFGESVYAASIPAVVREGDLAPFAEMVWLTEPTEPERQWLREEGTRFVELITQLTDPTFGSTPFLTWLDLRFRAAEMPFAHLQRRHPALCDAALRMHHHGLLGLPEGARLGEQHRQPPTPEDWVLLLEDWLERALVPEQDDQVREAVRRALPSVGYQLTRAGIRRGRTPVDRVLARSAAKTRAAVEITGHEHAALGERMRTLILCDHERASAVLPVDLQGVLDQQSGSAYAVLAGLVADPVTAALGPLLVTGQTVAGAPQTLADLRDHVARAGLSRAAELVVLEADDGLATLSGPWASRAWVRHVTAFFQAGGAQVLVGTRALLGEGWDAPRITGLIDLTAVTTTTAVVQTRGRALRVDPAWPEKVALNWSVVCVAAEHPKGHNDWERLVRKHDGFLAVDDEGDIVDGVAHLDAALSPFAPPPAEEFDVINARMLIRAQRRDLIRERWRVGEAYTDTHGRTLRIRASRSALGAAADRPPVVAGAAELVLGPGAPTPPRRYESIVLGGITVLLLLFGLIGRDPWVVVSGILAAAATWWVDRQMVARHQHRLHEVAAAPVGVGQLARAVADGLRHADLTSVGAEGVGVEIDHDGRYRCHLDGVPEPESELFATSLEEVLTPVTDPRYLISRWSLAPSAPAAGRWRRRGGEPATVEVWYPVPTVLGRKARHADTFRWAWNRWVGEGRVLYTRSADGAGVLSAVRGADPFAATSVMRRHWT